MLEFLLKPSPALLVLYVIAIKKGQEAANVQPRTHDGVFVRLVWAVFA